MTSLKLESLNIPSVGKNVKNRNSCTGASCETIKNTTILEKSDWPHIRYTFTYSTT